MRIDVKSIVIEYPGRVICVCVCVHTRQITYMLMIQYCEVQTQYVLTRNGRGEHTK